MPATQFVSVGLTDYAGRRGTTKVFWPAGAGTLAEVTAFAQAYAIAVDDISGCLINGLTVTLSIPLPGPLKGAAVTNADRQEGVLAAFDAANTVYNHGIFIPGINPSVMTGQELTIGVGSPGEAWRDLLLTGVAPILPSNAYADRLTALLSTERRFRRK